MSRKKIIILIILIAGGFGVWYGYREYTRTNKDLSKVTADIKIGALDLIKEYEQNDSVANRKYLGKVVEVSGIVKELPKDYSGSYTIVLGDTSTRSSVRCSMDTIHQKDASSLTVGSSAILRGNCTGFNKDELGLGSDVILNRSVLVK